MVVIVPGDTVKLGECRRLCVIPAKAGIQAVLELLRCCCVASRASGNMAPSPLPFSGFFWLPTFVAVIG